MRSKPTDIPAFKLHKGSGQGYAVVDGRRVYFGRFDDTASRRRYDRWVVEWLAGGRHTVPSDVAGLTVCELVAAFWKYAERFYADPVTGKPSREFQNFNPVLRPLNDLYGDTPVADFGPRNLKAVRERHIGNGWSRGYVNKAMRRIRQVFKWGTAEGLVPPSVFHGLQAVDGLKRGRCEAPETKGVRPVANEHVDAMLPFLSKTVRAMIELQRLTGMRPGEVCILRACDVDTSGKVWLYRPETHKTLHRGRSREVFIGPRGQAVLKPFLKHDLQAYVFSPAQADRERRDALHAARKTPLSCGNRPGSCVKADPKKQPGERYTTPSYAKAIVYACDRAFPPPDGLSEAQAKAWRREHRWSPNALRHAYATAVRREHGLEAAQVLLGHSRADVTQVYAERDTAKAVDVARRIG